MKNFQLNVNFHVIYDSLLFSASKQSPNMSVKNDKEIFVTFTGRYCTVVYRTNGCINRVGTGDLTCQLFPALAPAKKGVSSSSSTTQAADRYQVDNLETQVYVRSLKLKLGNLGWVFQNKKICTAIPG